MCLDPDTRVSAQRVTGHGRRPACLLELTEPGCVPVRYALPPDLALRLASSLVDTLTNGTR